MVFIIFPRRRIRFRFWAIIITVRVAIDVFVRTFVADTHAARVRSELFEIRFVPFAPPNDAAGETGRNRVGGGNRWYFRPKNREPVVVLRRNGRK